MLRSHNAPPVAVYSAQPDGELQAEAGAALLVRWPIEGDLADIDVMFVAGLPVEEAQKLRALARRSKVLVNVEDVRHQCDFHVPATVRRGDLLVTVSTGGASPGLARRIATRLGELFGHEWADRVRELARARDGWRRTGMDFAALKRETDHYIDQKGWLS